MPRRSARLLSIFVGAAATLTLVLAPVRASAQAAAPVEPFAIGSTVQLQGCVIEGERKGSFVFSRVTAYPVAALNGEFGPRFFWLMKFSEQLGAHIGKTVQVTGTVAEIRESEVERNPGFDSRNGRRVAIELPDGDVFTQPELAGIGTAGHDSKIDTKVTMIGVKVESLLVVMAKCLPTFQ